MEDLKIRKDQHAKQAGKKYTMKKGLYALKKEENMMLLRFLQSIRMPDGYASHIKRCVVLEQCKFSGLKSHDCHVILQKLLPIPLLQLSKFFSDLCSKELRDEDLENLGNQIPEILCKLERHDASPS